jgi:hypothetical protein
MTILAIIGVTALWLTYAWLASAIVASWLSERKGYGEKPGLACGLLLSVIGVVLWLVWPAREGSKWKVLGPMGSRPRERPRAPAEPSGPPGTGKP